MQRPHDSEQTAQNGMKKLIDAVTDDVCLHPPAGLTDRLKEATDSGNLECAEEILWETLESFAGYPFKTAKGLAFTYFVKGRELFFTRKEKSVTRASVRMAFEAAVRLQSAGVKITGPKMNPPPRMVLCDRAGGALRPLKWCNVAGGMVH